MKIIGTRKGGVKNNCKECSFSYDECHALIEACCDHLKPVDIAAINTGMRKSEIQSLKWNQVDLKHGFILLDKTKNGHRREIPINHVLQKKKAGLTYRFLQSFGSPAVLRLLIRPVAFRPPLTARLALSRVLIKNYQMTCLLSRNIMIQKLYSQSGGEGAVYLPASR